GAYRMTHAWSEVGATWSCAHDSNPQNLVADCAGGDAWTMAAPAGLFAAQPTATSNVTNGLAGTVAFDVTADGQAWISKAAPNDGWLLALTNEKRKGKIDFGPSQSASPPRLVLVDDGGGTTSITGGEPPPTDSIAITASADTHLRSASKNKN